MAGWHHWLDGRESEWTPGVGVGQGGLACCNSWSHKESHMTEQLNWTELNLGWVHHGRWTQWTWVWVDSGSWWWTGRPGVLQFVGSQRVGHDSATKLNSASKLNKQGDSIQPWLTPFPIWNQSIVPCLVLTVASWTAYRFLKRQVNWSGIPISLRIFHSLLWSMQSKALA